MARLRHHDLAGFSRALALLYSAADMDSLAGRVTRCLHALFPCELASFDLIDLSAVRWNTLVISPVLPRWLEAVEVLQRHAHEHPIVSHAVRHHYTHAIRTSDLLSLRQYRQTGIYTELFRPYVMGTDRQLGFVARPDAALTLGVSVNRRGRDFSGEELTLLERLQAHLWQAYVTARTHARVGDGERAPEREAIAQLAGGGLCQTDAAGRLAWATTGAEALCARYFPADKTRAGSLPPSLFALVRHAARGNAGNPFAPPREVEIRRAHGTLRVRLAAHAPPGGWLLLLAEDAVSPTAKELAAGHGLARREAETLYWVGQGKTNLEIGLIMGISRRTVDKHVERLFEKLAVHNRTAAARIALGQ